MDTGLDAALADDQGHEQRDQGDRGPTKRPLGATKLAVTYPANETAAEAFELLEQEDSSLILAMEEVEAETLGERVAELAGSGSTGVVGVP